MCSGADHFCSACGTAVDSGKTGEYKVYDFIFSIPDMGKRLDPQKPPNVESERTVLCRRCLKDPRNKDLLALFDTISKAPKPEPVKRARMKTGLIQCTRCGKRLTDTRPALTLSVTWDVSYQKAEACDPYIICKRCYSSDVRLREVWKYLAKLGKNPTFQPRVGCSSWSKCATYEPGKHPFNCRFITMAQTTTPLPQLLPALRCARFHPKTWKLPEIEGHPFPKASSRKGPTFSLGQSGSATIKLGKNKVVAFKPPTPDKLVRMVLKAMKVLKKAKARTKEPGIKGLIEAQEQMMRVIVGPIGLDI